MISIAEVKGLEPSIYGLTGRRDNQLRYTSKKYSLSNYPERDSNA
jgi:hypothetical protein